MKLKDFDAKDRDIIDYNKKLIDDAIAKARQSQNRDDINAIIVALVNYENTILVLSMRYYYTGKYYLRFPRK